MALTATFLIAIIARTVLGTRAGSTSQTTASYTVVLDVYGDSGSFLSPGYPKQYSNNMNMTYTAQLDSSGLLTVRLEMDLDLETAGPQSCFDYVRIGSANYCGRTSTVTEVEISGNQLSILFISDGSRVYSGFNITFTVIQVKTTTITTTATTTEQESLQVATENSTSSASADTSASSDDTGTVSIATSTTDDQPFSEQSMETSYVTVADTDSATPGLALESESDWLPADANSEDSMTSEVTPGDVSVGVTFTSSCIEESADEEDTRSNDLSTSGITDSRLATLPTTSLEISTVMSVDEKEAFVLLESSSSASLSVVGFWTSITAQEREGGIQEREGGISATRTSFSTSPTPTAFSSSSRILPNKVPDDEKEKDVPSLSVISTKQDFLFTSFDQSTFTSSNVLLLPVDQRTPNSETPDVVNTLIDEKTSINFQSVEFTGKLITKVIATETCSPNTVFLRSSGNPPDPTAQQTRSTASGDDVTSDITLATSYLGEILSSWEPSSEVNSVSHDILPLGTDSGMTSAAPPIPNSCKCHFLWTRDNATDALAWQRATTEASRLVQALTVNKDNVSSLKRRKISAPDGRLSAATFGVIVTAVCALPVVLLTVTDILGMCVRTRSPWSRRGVATSRRDVTSHDA